MPIEPQNAPGTAHEPSPGTGEVFLRWVATVGDPLIAPRRAQEWFLALRGALGASRGAQSLLWASAGEFLVGLATQIPRDDPFASGRHLSVAGSAEPDNGHEPVAGALSTPAVAGVTATDVLADGIESMFDWDAVADEPLTAAELAVIRWATGSRLGQGMSLSAVASSLDEIDAAARAILRRWRSIEPYADIRGFVCDEGWAALLVAERVLRVPSAT